MKKLNYFIAVLIVLWGVQACNQEKRQDTVKLAEEANNGEKVISSLPDMEIYTQEAFTNADFAVKAADIGLTEVTLGQIALLNTFEQNIKDFGQMMLDDHKKINKELTELAVKKGITLPPSPGLKNVKKIKDINQDVGKDFDRHYIDMMMDLNKKDIKLFEMATKRATDMDVKNFAINTLPILKKHLEVAESLQKSMGTKK